MHRSLALFALLLTACPTLTGTKAPPPSSGATVDGTLECKGKSGASWTATFTANKVDECIYKAKDQTLDVRVGTVEQGITIHVVDFTGSGQYKIGSGSGAGSKLAITAKGGIEGITSTIVDSATPEPCTASCEIDVPEAGVAAEGNTITLEVSCAKLTRVDSGACVTCTPKAAQMIRAVSVACRRE